MGVDNGSPAGHNFEYTNFFPSTINVQTGDTIDFSWNTGSADGLHTATLFQTGHTAANFGPPVIAAAGDPAINGHPAQDISPAILAPTGNVLASSCGTAANPCPVNGTADTSSGAVPTAVGNDFVVSITAATGTTIHYACLIHPFRMHGTINVVTSRDTTQTVAAAAAAEYTASTTAALTQESAVNTAGSAKNANGTTTWSVHAGSSTPVTNPDHPVEILEMLPSNISIHKGDTVTWAATSPAEIHTVTFPDAATVANQGPVLATNPIPFLCDAGNGHADTNAPGGPPPNFGCAAPAENGYYPYPQGVTAISSGTTVGSSGILTPTTVAFPNSQPSYSYTFPSNGTFAFMCHIHAHMFGTVFTAGYRSVASDGGIFTHGANDFFGSTGNLKLNKPVVGGAQTPDNQGYYMVASDGGIFTFGDAKFSGSMGGTPLNKPAVGMAVTPDGGGYYEVASDGGIFTFGDAKFMGSMGAKPLNQPVVGMAVTPDGGGYYLVAADGGIFTFGDASFMGSMGGTHLNKPVVGMAATSDGAGYYMVASDGGIFTFGSAHFLGSMGGTPLNMPMVGMQLTTTDAGYRMVASDGGIFDFGDAGFFGSEGGIRLNKPVVGMMGS